MKTIDWKEVSSNPQMSKQFTLEVYNRFESLSSSEITTENVDDVYDTLVKVVLTSQNTPLFICEIKRI